MFKYLYVNLLLLVFNTASGQISFDSTGRISITVVDGITDEATPVRVRISQGGNAWNMLSSQAIAVMYGQWDHADGFGFQPDSSFYVDGYFDIQLPPGYTTYSCLKGWNMLINNIR